MVGFGEVPLVFMLAMILAVNYPHKAALNYYSAFWPSKRSSHFYIGEAHTQFRRYSRHQQMLAESLQLNKEKKLEQRAMMNAWNKNMCAN